MGDSVDEFSKKGIDYLRILYYPHYLHYIEFMYQRDECGAFMYAFNFIVSNN